MYFRLNQFFSIAIVNFVFIATIPITSVEDVKVI